MNAITFDTYKAIRKLTAEGVSEKQAAAIVDTIRENNFSEIENLATKADISLLKSDMSTLKTEMVEIKAEIIKWVATGFMAMMTLQVATMIKIMG